LNRFSPRLKLSGMSETKRLTIRLALSVVFGLCVMMVPLWLIVGNVPYINSSQVTTRGWMKRLDRELQSFRVQHGQYPATLEDLGLGWGLKDVWNHPFLYSVADGKPLVKSLGRDGVRGGVGLDADFSNQNPRPPESAVPLWQKVTHPITLRMDVVALVCGVIVGLMFFQDLSKQSFERKTWPALGFSFPVTFLLAAFGALVITSAHIPSGH